MKKMDDRREENDDSLEINNIDEEQNLTTEHHNITDGVDAERIIVSQVNIFLINCKEIN